MEFHDENIIWGAHDVYGNSNMGSDDEETLSFCDLPVYGSAGMSAELKGMSRDSNYESSEHEDFEFNAGLFNSLSYHYTADELFRNGRLLPCTESNKHFEYGISNSYRENRLMSNEKLQGWRTDSLESQSSYRTTSSPNISQASHDRKLNHSASEKVFRQVKSSISTAKSISTPHRTSSTASKFHPLRTKTSLNWQRFFSFGIIKTPPMKVEKMRLRQQKPSDNGVEKLVLMRSVLFTNEQCPTLAKKEDPRAAIFHQKSKPIMTSMRSKEWRMIAPVTSLNCCKAFISVTNCGTANNRADRVPKIDHPKDVPLCLSTIRHAVLPN